MKTEVTYRGGSGAQGKMEVSVECGKCGGVGEVSLYCPWAQNGMQRGLTIFTDKCFECHGTGREVKE